MMPTIITLVVLAGSIASSPVRYDDLALGDPWAIIPVYHHQTGARPQWNDSDAPADGEAELLLWSLGRSVQLVEKTSVFDCYLASEAIVTWDHGRFALGRLIQDLEFPPTAYNAAMAVRRIGPYAESAIPTLLEIVQRKNDFPKLQGGSGPDPYDRRAYAALALGGIGPKAGRAVPAMIPLLADKSPYTRWAAAKAVGEIGESAKAALAAALRDTDDEVRFAAALSSWRIGKDPKSVRVLADLAKGSRLLRGEGWAMRALGEIGPPAKDTVPFLTTALKSKDWRVDAAEALCQIDPQRPESWALLRSLLQDESRENRNDRFRAAVILASAGREKTLAAKVLADNLHGDGNYKAATVMGVLLLDPELTVPPLTKALKAWTHQMRLAAAQALGRIGPPARAAIPALAELTKRNNIYVSREAAWAINVIQSNQKKKEKEDK
jgi:HEAT repeat protein